MTLSGGFISAQNMNNLFLLSYYKNTHRYLRANLEIVKNDIIMNKFYIFNRHKYAELYAKLNNEVFSDELLETVDVITDLYIKNHKDEIEILKKDAFDLLEYIQNHTEFLK